MAEQFQFELVSPERLLLSAEVEQVTRRSPYSKKFVEEHVRVCTSLFFREPRPAPALQAKPKRTTRKSAKT